MPVVNKWQGPGGREGCQVLLDSSLIQTMHFTLGEQRITWQLIWRLWFIPSPNWNQFAWALYPCAAHFPAHSTLKTSVQFSSVQSLSHVWLLAIPWIAACQASLSITTPGVHSNSRPSSQWYHPAVSSSVIPFPPAPNPSQHESFPVSQFFASGGQNIGVSASVSVLPVNIQDWFLLGWTGWISLQSKELSRIFSNTTVQKHQFFSAQVSL